MLHIGSVARGLSLRVHLRLILAIGVLLFCVPNSASSAEEGYYYLHVSSFRSEKSALEDANKMRDEGYEAIARRERVPNKGYWYRVYVGPFSSLGEAQAQKEEISGSGLAGYVAIRKMASLLSPGSESTRTRVERRAPVPREATPPVRKERVTAPRAPRKPPPAQRARTRMPTREEPPQAKAAPPPAPTKPPERVGSERPVKRVDTTPMVFGRNMDRRDLSLGLRHTYRSALAQLTKRSRITSDGTTTSVEDVLLQGQEKEEFSTSLHMDSIRVRYGVTGFLEFFAEFGGTYREISSLGFTYGGAGLNLLNLGYAYGGGGRLNLFRLREGWFRGLYVGLQGEYMTGGIEYEDSSVTADNPEKEIDWEEFVAKAELGMTRSRYAPYIGVVYLAYSEVAERRQLEDDPPSVLLDELEETQSFGVYGGISVHLTPSFVLNIEGQGMSQESILASIEFHY